MALKNSENGTYNDKQSLQLVMVLVRKDGNKDTTGLGHKSTTWTMLKSL